MCSGDSYWRNLANISQRYGRGIGHKSSLTLKAFLVGDGIGSSLQIRVLRPDLVVKMNPTKLACSWRFDGNYRYKT